jgi:hypothetical protein
LTLFDGGLFSTISIGDPIQRCREEGVSDEDIIVDVIMCYSKIYEIGDWELGATRWKTALDFY